MITSLPSPPSNDEQDDDNNEGNAIQQPPQSTTAAPPPPPTVYFNNAGQAPLAPNVQKIGCDMIHMHPSVAHVHAEQSQRRVRELFANLIQVVPPSTSSQSSPTSTSTSTNSSIRRKLLLSQDIPHESSTVSIMPSTAFAITLAARNLQRTMLQREKQNSRQLQPTETEYRVLVLQDQFDSAIYPWQQICSESLSSGDNSMPNVKLDIVDHPSVTEYDGWTRAILEKLSSVVVSSSTSSSPSSSPSSSSSPPYKYLAVCLPPVHWSDGSIIDLKLIGSVCSKAGIPLIVDATQAVGIMTLQCYKIRPTMMVCSTHKWLRGPSGMCLAYINPTVYDSWLPLDLHGRGRDFGAAGSTTWNASKNEMGPHGYPATFYKDARKFDSGGKSNAILLPMLATSMESLIKLDFKHTQQHLKSIMEPLITWTKQTQTQQLQSMSLDDSTAPSSPSSSSSGSRYTTCAGPRAYHIIGLIPMDKTPQELLRMAHQLQTQFGIVVAVRCGGLRISPYVDTTPEQVTKLIHALEVVGQHPFANVVSSTTDL